jgi:hypothetical protein
VGGGVCPRTGAPMTSKATVSATANAIVNANAMTTEIVEFGE